ncbi:MAG: amidohydrolase family protein [Gammaproteobacteria bacterium]|nr:amidohydrolase family protein [Gammaproteobacteria bacterium]
MIERLTHVLLAATAVVAAASATPAAAATAAPGPEVQPFVAMSAPAIALRHVTLIDGTGAEPRADQTVVFERGRISAIGPANSTAVPAGAESHDYPGYTVLPGLVGMHDHFYYSASNALQRGDGKNSEPGFQVNEIAYTAPRLYLAGGVTTLRTTGSVEPYADIKVHDRIAAGLMPGPDVDLTAPYLEGGPTPFAQMHELRGADDARRFVAFWAESGMTSFKAYMNITRDELAAAAAAAHARGMKITGHLCSVTWPEAVAAGIDDFEHGPVYTDSEFYAGKQPDTCPRGRDLQGAWKDLPIDGPQVRVLIRLLIDHHVAVTSTLPVFEQYVPGNPPPQRRTLEAMATGARASYLQERASLDPKDHDSAALLRKEMDFELAFASAGGLLLAGPDPTGNGGVLPGFGNQREVELLVDAGFTPVAAIHVATQNGARFLGRDADIGTLATGKRANLMLVKGDPGKHIADIENVELVFKDGVGYDSARLIESVRGQVGVR